MAVQELRELREDVDFDGCPGVGKTRRGQSHLIPKSIANAAAFGRNELRPYAMAERGKTTRARFQSRKCKNTQALV